MSPTSTVFPLMVAAATIYLIHRPLEYSYYLRAATNLLSACADPATILYSSFSAILHVQEQRIHTCAQVDTCMEELSDFLQVSRECFNYVASGTGRNS